MKKFILFLTVLCLASVANAQWGWGYGYDYGANAFFQQQMMQAAQQVQQMRQQQMQQWHDNWNNVTPVPHAPVWDNTTVIYNPAPVYEPTTSGASNESFNKQEILNRTVGEDCQSCHGTGKCHACNGTKVASGFGNTYTCTLCDSQGNCPVCQGTGKARWNR